MRYGNWQMFKENQVNETAWELGRPAYTFPEIWRPLDEEQRWALLTYLSYRSRTNRDDITEAAGEWLIDNGHVEVTAADIVRKVMG